MIRNKKIRFLFNKNIKKIKSLFPESKRTYPDQRIVTGLFYYRNERKKSPTLVNGAAMKRMVNFCFLDSKSIFKV